VARCVFCLEGCQGGEEGRMWGDRRLGALYRGIFVTPYTHYS